MAFISRRHFQMHFLYEKSIYFDKDFTEICSQGSNWNIPALFQITHWGRVTQICVSETIIIGSDNGLSPGRRQAIIWTNAGILLIGPLGMNFSEILIEINIVSFNKMYLKMSSAKWRLFRLCLNVIMDRRRPGDDNGLVHWRFYVSLAFNKLTMPVTFYFPNNSYNQLQYVIVTISWSISAIDI